ncbi:MAG: hypothetical protein ABL912_02640 [Novosphingobium sp.]
MRKTTNKFAPKVSQRAVCMVLEWVKKAEVNSGNLIQMVSGNPGAVQIALRPNLKQCVDR